MAANVYFDLTRTFNATGPNVVLASGQAVVFHRVAIMSKDGDWIVREDEAACVVVLRELAARGAWYRPGAPLDIRWLSGGWSSHFEHRDEQGRRVRCDFFSRPPRVGRATVRRMFETTGDPLVAVDVETLIRMKRTQREKDYAVIGELASRLPPEREVLLTTDADRILALAREYGAGLARPAVRAARSGDREAVMVALARERNRQQQADHRRLEAFVTAAAPFLSAFADLDVESRRLPAAHELVCQVAERWLPTRVATEGTDVDVE